MDSNVVAISMDNFQQVVLEDSKTKLVLVAFWAEQVPESVDMVNKFAAQLAQAGEQITLATVDCQQEQQIAMQFGIQGLPTIVMMKDGQPIDGLAGPQSDEAIATLLDKYLPKAQDHLLAQAKQALTEHDVKAAFTAAIQAYQLDNERADIKLTLADAHLKLGKIDDAKTLLATIKMVDQDSYYQSLMATLELASEAANSPEITALEQTLADDPQNCDIIYQLAAQYCQVNRHEEALAILFTQVQKNAGDTESKRILLEVLKALPQGDPLVAKYRRKLYTLLY